MTSILNGTKYLKILKFSKTHWRISLEQVTYFLEHLRKYLQEATGVSIQDCESFVDHVEHLRLKTETVGVSSY